MGKRGRGRESEFSGMFLATQFGWRESFVSGDSMWTGIDTPCVRGREWAGRNYKEAE